MSLKVKIEESSKTTNNDSTFKVNLLALRLYKSELIQPFTKLRYMGFKT